MDEYIERLHSRILALENDFRQQELRLTVQARAIDDLKKTVNAYFDGRQDSTLETDVTYILRVLAAEGLISHSDTRD
jgi:predicted DNA-binding protein with PD1-like motif